jgi:hypothetical protein
MPIKPVPTFSKWVYPPDYPLTPGHVVSTQPQFDQLISEGWHADTKFISLKTGLKAEIKRLEATLADRKQRLEALYGDTPDAEGENAERACNICGVTFYTPEGYSNHMAVHLTQANEG